MEDKKKKVLIVGASAKEFALAKKFKEYSCDIFVAPGNSAIEEIAECVDIREDNVQELMEFVLENAIDFTIVSSEKAVKQDIAELFQANGLLIFAPSAVSANIAISRSFGKKFLYRLKIPAPRFAIFDKLPSAVDYLKTASMPQVIRTDEAYEGKDRLVCTTFSTAKTFVEDLFAKGENKIVLEDYVYGHEFTFYVITDGYSALPLTSVANYKFSENGNGGILTSGTGAYTPDYKISSDMVSYIMQNIVSRVLDELQKKESPYSGILGIDCVLAEDGRLCTLAFKSFLSDHDAQAVLNIIDEDLLLLFEACAVGSFADDYDSIKILDNASVSCVVSSRLAGKVIEGLDLVESDITNFGIKRNQYLEYETIEGRNFVLTKTAKTLSRARTHLYEDIDLIKFEGKKYRTDICGQVEIF